MVDYKIAIPSKGRPMGLLLKTYKKIIDRYGLNCNQIHIFVSSKEDLELYKTTIPIERYFKLVLGPNGLTETFNFITDYFAEDDKVLLLQDDVTGFYQITKKDKLKLEHVDDFKAVVNTMFTQLDNRGLSLGGFYPVTNETWMDKSQAITTDLKFIFDPIRCFVNRKKLKLTIDFNGVRSTKQDVENSILYYIRDGGVLRFNHYCFRTIYNNPKLNGGFADPRTHADELAVARGIVDKYPLFAQVKYSLKGRPNVRLVDRRKLKKNKNKSFYLLKPLKKP